MSAPELREDPPAAAQTAPEPAEHLDVLIIGAGISGIGAAVHLQRRCPNKRYAIIEARARLGGTWDLFRYPGIRSDSDMFTLGFAFRPWREAKAIADGPAILRYLEESAREFGVDRQIRYGLRMERARWSSAERRWRVELRDQESGEVKVLSCSFLFAATGYYRYDRGFTPEFPGRERFAGTIVHPQLWPEDLDYAGKKIIVIGSGATAMTLVPALAEKAAHVTMLQRSPTYVISAPSEDKVAAALLRRLPTEVAYALARWKNIGVSSLFYRASRRFPKAISRFLIEGARRRLPAGYDVERHFTPRYKPWDQRLCLVPRGDIFKAIRRGAASVVTDTIETFTERGIRLRSGEELEADIIVTATGLELQLFGGAELWVDGRRIDVHETMAYRAMMLGGVPNLAFAVGYTNASWTLKVELVAEYVCRLLRHMDAHGYASCRPRLDPSVPEAPLLNFSAGYVAGALPQLPRGGARHPRRVFEDYALDRITLKAAPIDDGVLDFER
ncbi:MAG: NAD(P)/FAD-dependent oxidoreductase [Myxococcales bacterium]|nr:NAD(P)/FAD-dependent oxidoreductase [Myxococcales bacterium]